MNEQPQRHDSNNEKNEKLGELANPGDREALKAAIRRALRRPREIPEGVIFFSYERFRERLHDIMDSLRIESLSTA